MTNKRWRPDKDWRNPYKDAVDDLKLPANTKVYRHTMEKIVIAAFEDGADAMLDALFEMAKESPTGAFVIDSKEQHIYLEE